jgi:hypothetical protein
MNLKNKELMHTQKYAFKLLLIILLFASSFTAAQETIVVGQVLNKADNSPILGANISFKNTEVAAQTNEEGYFLIRTTGKQTNLVFSYVGFQKRELKIKPGQSIGVQVTMTEENTLLQEAFIFPGANPAIGFMKKVRLMRKVNDISQQVGFNANSTEQNLVLLSKINQHSVSKRIFDQLKKGNIAKSDSTLVVPLYMAESKYNLTSKGKKELSENIFSSPVSSVKIIKKLVGELDTELNFYDNSITVYGKSMVSPLANVGNAYYEYYLADSLKSENGKQYEIHFRSKNSKNLAFDGKLWIDSATFALTKIEAELPTQANINFIHNLRILQQFKIQPNNHWLRDSEVVALKMNYELLTDSLHPKPEIFVKHSAAFQYKNSVLLPSGNFAKSNYNRTTLDEKLNDLNNTPLLRTAKWIADIIFTGYIPVGKIDIGKIEQIIRITDVEGLRLTLPFRTNEKLWKNISLGGYLGYGFKNELAKYSGMAQFKISSDKWRVLSLNYTDDYRRIDYNYNDFMFRENPLVTGDEDISSSVFALKSARKISERKEFSISFANDWNSDIKSSFYLRNNQLFANDFMPMTINGTKEADFLTQQSATFVTRFSFNERNYEDHTQRIYISNNKPVIYSILEAGKYKVGSTSGNYAKIIGSVKQNIRFYFGQFNYIAEAGWIVGNVPYQLLEIPPGSETGGYCSYEFNMMNYMEYAADKYLNLHTELMLNGLLMNQIPLIKELNLREMCSFNLAYGSLSDSHRSQLDYPSFMYPLNKPYMEVGVGLTNILHIIMLQSVWRLTDLNHPGAIRWGIRGCLSLSF